MAGQRTEGHRARDPDGRPGRALVGAGFDATGMGWTVAEDMGREFGIREDFEEGAGLIMALKFTEEWYRCRCRP